MTVCKNCKTKYDGDICPSCGKHSLKALIYPVCCLGADDDVVCLGISSQGTNSSDVSLPSYGSHDKPKYEALVCGLSFELEGEGYVVKGKGACRATDIVIPSEYRGLPVTGIGSRAFYGCDFLKSVIIPDSVTSIDFYAFFECKSLKSIIIPDSVKTIGYNAFYHCLSLETVKMGKGVTSVSGDAFLGCKSLIGVYADDLGSWCTIDFENPTSNPLFYVKKLHVGGIPVTDLAVPGGVTSIGRCAFYNCKQLASVTLPDSVTSIGESAFGGCEALKDIDFGVCLTSIGPSAFTGCLLLASVSIPDSVTSIGENAFSQCKFLKDIAVGSRMAAVGTDAFRNCLSLENVHITDVATWCEIDFGNPASNPLFYAKNLYLDGKPVMDLLIPNTVKSIGAYAFCNCLLRSLIIPSSVTQICEHAFSGCTSLKTVSVPSSVKTIGEYAFYDCKSLVCVYATDLSAWCGIDFGNQSSNPLNYGADMYLDNHCLTELSFPDSFTSIRPYLFCGCKSLKKITIGNGVTSVEDFAFFKCSSLTSVEIPRSVTSIGSDAFNSCTSLKSVAIPDSVTVIGDNAFFNCKSLKTVTIGEAVLSLGISAFGGCTSVGKLIFNASEMHDLSFKNNVFCDFAGATAGMTLTIGPNVTRIPAYLFYPCEETSSVPKISSVIFEKNSRCASIGESAFGYCTTIKKVYYSGDRDDWDRMVFGPYNNTLQHMARLYLYSENKPFSEGDFWHCDKKGIPVEWERLTASKTVEPDNLFVTLPGTQKTEGSYSLNDESAFVTLRAADASEDDGVKFSEWLNFKKEGDHYRVEGMGDCEDTDISIPPEHNGMPVISIRGFAFYDCPEITSVIIPGSVTSIGEFAFSKCINLRSAIIPTSVKSIGGQAFENCSALVSIDIPSSVTSLGLFVFSGCRSLTSITIPSSLTSIPYRTFDYCKQLSSVTIPDTVKFIDSYAFTGCESLKDVFYSGSQSDWKKISIGKDNAYLKNATIYFNCNKQS